MVQTSLSGSGEGPGLVRVAACSTALDGVLGRDRQRDSRLDEFSATTTQRNRRNWASLPAATTRCCSRLDGLLKCYRRVEARAVAMGCKGHFQRSLSMAMGGQIGPLPHRTTQKQNTK